MLISLVGYRGSGKSTVAPRLASRLSFDWVDADQEIEQQTGRTIREIFATDGEAEFRRIEREILVQLLKRDRLVIAAGGGAILDAATRVDIRAAGSVIWLNATVTAIARRILRDGTTTPHRPSLTSLSGYDEIQLLLAQREPFYRECATIIVDTEGMSIEAITQQILARLPSEYRQEKRA